jgi:hypothetical protein
MENKLDKLFRDKLEHHSMQPSANAWEKVAAGFPKKNNTIVWVWRMAAAVALLGIVGILIFNSLDSDKSTEMANDNTPKVEETTPVDSNKQEVKPMEIQKVVPQPEHPVAQKKESEQINKSVFNQPVVQDVAEVKQETIKENIEAVTETIVTPQEEIAVAKVEETQPKAEQQKTRVLVYSLAAVERKPEEQPAKVKPLQRVLTFAKDVKGGETTTLASVRNWKDNLLGTDETTRIEKQNNNN